MQQDALFIIHVKHGLPQAAEALDVPLITPFHEGIVFEEVLLEIWAATDDTLERLTSISSTWPTKGTSGDATASKTFTLIQELGWDRWARCPALGSRAGRDRRQAYESSTSNAAKASIDSLQMNSPARLELHMIPFEVQQPRVRVQQHGVLRSGHGVKSAREGSSDFERISPHDRRCECLPVIRPRHGCTDGELSSDGCVQLSSAFPETAGSCQWGPSGG